MKPVIQEYQISNFKAFANTAVVPIRPITLIYGANSSGKSSVIQSLLMLKQTLEATNDNELILFSTGNLVNLGNYRDFIHNHELDRSFTFKISLQIDPYSLPEIIQELCEKEISQDSLISLQVSVSYFDSQIIFDSVDFFIGNSPESFAKFALNEHYDLQIIAININHIFWQNWFALSKSEIQKAFLGVIKKGCKSFGIKMPRSKKLVNQKLEELKLQKIATLEKIKIKIENIENNEFQEKDSGMDQIEDEIDRLNVMIDLQKHFERYTIEKFGEDYINYLRYSQYIEYRNFLPRQYCFYPANDVIDNRLEYLSEVYNELRFSNSFSIFVDFLSSLILDLINNVVYIGPLRNYPERFYISSNYSNEQVGKTGQFMSGLLFKNDDLLKKVNQKFKDFQINYQLKTVAFKTDDELNLETDIYTVNLVDENNISVSLLDVGFGISQVLPVLTQSLVSKNQTILIEQPELHLHPKLQAELGDLFIESALGEQKNTFIIETHSEHLMLRIMRRIRETSKKVLPNNRLSVRPEDVSVLFVQCVEGRSIIREMPLNSQGEFVKSWPGGFFEEELDELF